MSHRIKKVEYLEGYKLKLQFENNKIKIVDLENFLKDAENLLAPLKKLDYFQQVACDGVTICWPNGMDLCPDLLYSMGKEKRRAVSRPKKTIRSPVKRRKIRAKETRALKK